MSSDIGSLESLQSLHRELLAVCQHRFENVEVLRLSLLEHADAFKRLLDKPARDSKSRSTVQSGKIKIKDDEYQLNEDFVDSTLKLADELELDEIEAARVLLEAESDMEVMDRSLLECGILRFHQYRKFLLDCMRLCIELSDDEELEEEVKDMMGEITDALVFGVAVPGDQAPTPGKFVPRCLAAMADIRVWLQRITEKVATANLMYQSKPATPSEFEESIEYSRISLIQQHEALAVILCGAIEKHHSDVSHFKDFFSLVKKSDRYDQLLVHLFPALGAFINEFGSTEGVGDLRQARQLNDIVCKQDDTWPLSFLGATVRAWWIAEYSGWYLDDPVDAEAEGIDLDAEDEQRSKQFLEALKEGAFDFMLSVAADCKALDWQDPARSGMRQWLQRKSPPLSPEPIPFGEAFQKCLMVQLEVFIDAFISNLPDVLRRLRVEEDEQRQLSQTHDQDLDLERFLIIIAYSYEGRPDAADAFWSDPDSNLAGFLHWASRRASTPLVSAFCEMLQAISDNEECATAAHEFLLDEGNASSGKMRRTQSLTWGQIQKELSFFTSKIRERPTAAQANSFRAGKPATEQVETEPESAMMLECYLRLMTKLATESQKAREMLLLDPDFNLVEVLFNLASAAVPARLKACIFYALKALVTRKTPEQGQIMWRCLDNYMIDGYAVQPNPRNAGPLPSQPPQAAMDRRFCEVGEGFEEPNAYIQFLISLVTPVEGYRPLNDTLPFTEDLGAAVRQPGIGPYVDYVLGHVFAHRSKEVMDTSQLRILRLSCLDFAMACLSTFNENLIILGNEAGIAIDSAISTTDLATYVKLHPFARVMEWMFNDHVMEALFSTLHRDSGEVGNSAPDSPLIAGILRAIEVVTKVLDMQATYLDLVRPLVKTQSGHRRQPVANAAFASFDDGLVNHIDLVVDLGKYSGIGYPPLTLACLKLLEKISTSSKIISAWNPGEGRQAHRNKAIVALEKEGNSEAIAASLSSELTMTLDFGRKTESDNYLSKIYILNFLYETLKANPDQPTIAHQLLGFRCGVNSLTIEPQSSFDTQNALFHNLLSILLQVPFGENEQDGILGWLVTLKTKTMRILQVLWNSRLSSAIVLDELRALKFPFHLLLGEVLIEPQLRWDGQELATPDFLFVDGSLAYIDFLALRGMVFEYISMELCSVSQNRMPMVKREVLDALAGQVKGDENEPISVPNVFHLYDFVQDTSQWDIAEPEFRYHNNLDLKPCTAEIDGVVAFEIPKVEELILLKHNETRNAGQMIPQTELSAVEEEEAKLIQYLIYSNRAKSLTATRLRVLRAWTKLVLVLVETNEFKGTDRASLFQQALQAILPSLETFSVDSQAEAYELARLAKVLLFKIDFAPESTASIGPGTVAKGTPLGDKLFQLFQICLNAIGRWAGDADLRSIYYSICYRYITGIVDNGAGFISARQKTVKAIQVYGERLLNVICDDAYGSDPSCQTAAMILLGAFVNLGRNEDDTQVVEALNRLNFIGILVDSLKTLLQEWLDIIHSGGDAPQEFYISSKLSLLLHLSQTKSGAQYVLHANLLRVLETSGLFAADPDLEIDASDPASLEKHYGLLVRVTRIVAAAVMRQGSANILQGRRFLTQSRGLVVHVLKRSVGIGGRGPNAVGGKAQLALEERIEELAEAFMVLIMATDFLDFEDGQMPSERPKGTPVLFH
ncbi:nucleoporin Nup186/Nup192/Nup205 [Coniochaeta sp. 2T2.1]|nr:nucleoporin Nup186/Nup192/Nup205 [Coniochaeta sp. 2T2.1]